MAGEEDEKKPFGPSNPHPLYGKDPNIMNEYGHTHYPKFVKNKEGERVIVNDSDEEDDTELFVEPPKVEVKVRVPGKKAEGWGNK